MDLEFETVEGSPAERDSSVEDPISAYHEAGHAVACLVQGVGLNWVKIGVERLQNGDSIGGVYEMMSLARTDCIGKGMDFAMRQMIVRLAGPVAESRVHPHDMGPNSHCVDYQGAYEVATLAIGSLVRLGDNTMQPQIDRSVLEDAISRAEVATEVFVTEHWPKIEAVAQALLVKRYLTGVEVGEILGRKCDSGNMSQR
jgi:hypothetical protein